MWCLTQQKFLCKTPFDLNDNDIGVSPCFAEDLIEIIVVLDFLKRLVGSPFNSKQFLTNSWLKSLFEKSDAYNIIKSSSNILKYRNLSPTCIRTYFQIAGYFCRPIFHIIQAKRDPTVFFIYLKPISIVADI
jgi:hypothetical protein